MTNPEQLTEHLQVPDSDLYERVARTLGSLINAYGLRHEGAEVLSQIDGPCIVASIHRSNLDIPAIAKAALEASGTQLHFMGKQELWKIDWLGGIIKKTGVLAEPIKRTGWFDDHEIEWFGRKLERLGSFPVDREAQILPPETTKHIETLIEGNAAIAIFPEGTRKNRGPKIDPELMRGVHILAAKYGLPVVPVGISGTEKGDRHPIQVVYGEVINVSAPDRSWPKVARALLPEIAACIQNAQDRAIALRAQLL